MASPKFQSDGSEFTSGKCSKTILHLKMTAIDMRVSALTFSVHLILSNSCYILYFTLFRQADREVHIGPAAENRQQMLKYIGEIVDSKYRFDE
jgi:hypothetical protein